MTKDFNQYSKMIDSLIFQGKLTESSEVSLFRNTLGMCLTPNLESFLFMNYEGEYSKNKETI